MLVAEVGGVFGTLTYIPQLQLILPYSAYYFKIWPPTSSVGVWGPECSPMVHWCNEKNSQVPEPPIYVKMVDLPVLSMLTMGILYTKPPPYDFLNLYGACCTRIDSRACLTAIAGQIIYYLTRGVPGGQITRYFGHHSPYTLSMSLLGP
jgi:hypothetical protein